jgi:SPP1 gp7 family putative phage head morphogenesis protein
LNAALRQLYFGDGQFYELTPDDDDFQFDFDDSLFDAAAREILDNGGYTPDYLTTPTGSALINETNRAFTDAISKGLGEQPDPAVAAALRENAFIFSGFKTHAELEQVAQLITDENGNIRPFNEFLNDVKQLNQDYNHRYLRTEYNQAVQSAQMASKWADFERDKAHINLQYRTANDERVRASHRVLHGVTLPVDDKFWEQYTPPNGWGCRCTVIAVPKDDPDFPVQDSHGSIAKAETCFKTPKEKMFKENLAEKKKLFPSKHPYLPKGCGNCGKGVGSKNLAYDPNSLQCQVCAVIAKCKEKELGKKGIPLKERIEIYNRPVNDQYVQSFVEKGAVREHLLVCKTDKDYENVRTVAEIIAKEGPTVLIHPEVNYKETVGRLKIYPDFDENFRGNPDLWIKKYGYVDVKSPESRLKCIHWANHASNKQNAVVCLTNFRMEITERQIEENNSQIWKSKLYVQDVILWIIDGELKEYKRPE